MNRVLYEASYVGSSKGFFNTIMVVIVLVLGLIESVYQVKKAKRKCSTSSELESFQDIFGCIFEHSFLIVWGIASLIVIPGIIVLYGQVILGYKRGEYREVEGIVEDYTGAKVKTFTVNGVEFEISGYNVTWGYSYWQGKNVITGDGQHLKIRYIPSSNSIVYIEEIAEE